MACVASTRRNLGPRVFHLLPKSLPEALAERRVLGPGQLSDSPVSQSGCRCKLWGSVNREVSVVALWIMAAGCHAWGKALAAGMDTDVKLRCVSLSVKSQLSGGKIAHSSFMLLLFKEKVVHQPRCVPGASSLFRLLFICFDAKWCCLAGEESSPAEMKLLFHGHRPRPCPSRGPGQRRCWHCPQRGVQSPGGTSQPDPHFTPGPVGPFGRVESRDRGCSMPGASQFSRGGKAELEEGGFCIETFHNRACVSLRFLSWKALKVLPVWLILSQTCSAHRGTGECLTFFRVAPCFVWCVWCFFSFSESCNLSKI